MASTSPKRPPRLSKGGTVCWYELSMPKNIRTGCDRQASRLTAELEADDNREGRAAKPGT